MAKYTPDATIVAPMRPLCTNLLALVTIAAIVVFVLLPYPSCFSSTFALCKSTSYESIVLTLHWLNLDQIMSSLDIHRRKRIMITAGKQCDW